MTYPNYLLMINKVGSNRHCNHGNNAGREKYIFGNRSNHTTILSNNNNYGFVVFVFVSNNSNLIICVVIIKVRRLSNK